ncbi:MAG: hypothetical protein ABR899_09450 [Candidatus Krumholzibacteriaceae bacterium]|jgi:hypothetical protein
MRKVWIVALLILMMTGSSACLLEPRTAEKPTGTNQYPWITPNVYADVLANLVSGFASNNDSNYERSLEDSTSTSPQWFTFHPTLSDSLNPTLSGRFDNWKKPVELAWLRKIKGDYSGTRTLHFGNDTTGTFIFTDDRVSRVVLEGEYKITLQRTPGATQEVYAGIARFTLINGSQGWVMSGWTDLSARGTYSTTAGYLRGINR